jgi:DNA-binding MarR family transcriptional regulator
MTAATEARRLYRQRRRRDRYFPANLFAEPAWDILLDLYVAQAEGRATTTSSACIGAAVPQTTGLRWLTRLEDEGLVRRSTSAGDERMRLVTLTDDGFQRMTELLRKGG